MKALGFLTFIAAIFLFSNCTQKQTQSENNQKLDSIIAQRDSLLAFAKCSYAENLLLAEYLVSSDTAIRKNLQWLKPLTKGCIILNDQELCMAAKTFDYQLTQAESNPGSTRLKQPCYDCIFKEYRDLQSQEDGMTACANKITNCN